MYAIVEISGKQFKISENDVVSVPLLDEDEGKKVEFDRVLLISSDKGIKIGQPVVNGAKVKASILGHDREKKIVVFKKKRRKGYKVTRGHRQHFTKIQIDKITAVASKGAKDGS